MNKPHIPLSLLLLCPSALANDWVIPAGQTVIYNTTAGPVFVDNLVIESGATLRIVGAAPFRLNASHQILVDGALDLSGFDNLGVATLNTSDVPEGGAEGVCAGGVGGIGNANAVFQISTEQGGQGAGPFSSPTGGYGGESGYHPGENDELRRGAGGAGGAFALDQPVHPDPLHASNLGLIARAGVDGAPTALGALSGISPPQGGALSPLYFVDGNARNDFFGRKLVPETGQMIVGELDVPLAGSGGGAGGNAIQSAVFPDPTWSTTGEEKGAGGGGGGGLGILVAQRVELGIQGRIRANGGRGGGGENSQAGGITRVGGGSGGGSGGHLILQARVIDLRLAPANALTALGGRGGPGKSNVFHAEGAGGDGGPGIIQLHTRLGEAAILLAPGVRLDSRSSPDAHVLLPEPSL